MISPSPSSEPPRDLVQQGWWHLQLQRPLAAWASWQQALAHEPGQPAASEALKLLAQAGELPASARMTYRFRQPRLEKSRRAWDQAFQGHDLQVLDQAASAFLAILEDDPSDSAAQYNRALCLAWTARNSEAIACLDASVKLDAHDPKHFEDAVEAWLLAAVLRQGAGAELLADDFNQTLLIPWGGPGDPEPATLAPPEVLRPIILPDQRGQEGEVIEVFEWLDRPMPTAQPSLTQEDLPRVLATLFRTRDTLRLVSPRASALLQIEGFLADYLPDDDHRDRRSTPLPLTLLDASVWTFRLPSGLDEPTRARLTREAVEFYYETLWVQQPRTSLAEIGATATPIKAAREASKGDPVAKAKLLATIRFREQLAQRPATRALYAGYPFDRLRNRLGLEPDDSASVDLADPSCLNPDQLRALDPQKLDPSALAEAYQAALLFDDEELAARFAPEEAEDLNDRDDAR